MEIEKKYLVKQLPEHWEEYPFHVIEQGYLNADPVVRIRKQDEDYILTYKGSGMLAREEYNLPLDSNSYLHLLKKTDGYIINKKRYLIPYLNHTIELDIFDKPFAPLILAEVEFDSIEAANSFCPPEWFGRDVTYLPQFHNSQMAYHIPLSD